MYILNQSLWQHARKQQLYRDLPLITKTIKIKWTRHAGHCWRSRDQLISDVLLWTPSQGRAKAGRPARTYIQQLCADAGCTPEDLPETMDDKERWQEKVWDIRASSVTWWWWCIYIYIYIYLRRGCLGPSLRIVFAFPLVWCVKGWCNCHCCLAELLFPGMVCLVFGLFLICVEVRWLVEVRRACVEYIYIYIYIYIYKSFKR